MHVAYGIVDTDSAYGRDQDQTSLLFRNWNTLYGIRTKIFILFYFIIIIFLYFVEMLLFFLNNGSFRTIILYFV